MNRAAQVANAFAVNDSHAKNALGLALGQVVAHHRLHVLGPERVQVQHAVDGKFDGRFSIGFRIFSVHPRADRLWFQYATSTGRNEVLKRGARSVSVAPVGVPLTGLRLVGSNGALLYSMKVFAGRRKLRARRPRSRESVGLRRGDMIRNRLTSNHAPRN